MKREMCIRDRLIAHVPDVRWAVSVLALLAGFISAFVDNVATVLMVAPVGLAIARRLNSMGPLYAQDVADIKGALAQIWQ